MVSYQTWTRIAFDVAKDRGLNTTEPGGQRTLAGGRAFTDGNPNAQAILTFSTIWNERKAELQSASEHSAREIAEQEIVIR